MHQIFLSAWLNIHISIMSSETKIKISSKENLNTMAVDVRVSRELTKYTYDNKRNLE